MTSHLLPTSPYCTIGPFFPGTFVTGCEDMTSFRGIPARGQHIQLTGRVAEEGNRPIQNAVIEIWQADANGVFRHPSDPRFAEADPGFFGWGRVRTDAQGEYCFRTIMPGATLADMNGQQRCPHVNLMVLAIGLTRRLVTTVFFAEEVRHLQDPVANCVEDLTVRSRMLARRQTKGNRHDGEFVYRFDIVTRGEGETPFFLD